jgi:hypothetical protein
MGRRTIYILTLVVSILPSHPAVAKIHEDTQQCDSRLRQVGEFLDYDLWQEKSRVIHEVSPERGNAEWALETFDHYVNSDEFKIAEEKIKTEFENKTQRPYEPDHSDTLLPKDKSFGPGMDWWEIARSRRYGLPLRNTDDFEKIPMNRHIVFAQIADENFLRFGLLDHYAELKIGERGSSETPREHGDVTKAMPVVTVGVAYFSFEDGELVVKLNCESGTYFPHFSTLKRALQSLWKAGVYPRKVIFEGPSEKNSPLRLTLSDELPRGPE